MLAFQSLAVPTDESVDPLRKPFVALAGSLALIVGSAAVFSVGAPYIHDVVQQVSASLRATPQLFLALAIPVVCVNLFEAVVHVINAIGLWFNWAISRRPIVLRLSQHVDHLSRRPNKSEYLALNALDAAAFAAAFLLTGEFNVFWAIVFAPHLATMVLAAWELDLFLKLFLLDIRRFLPESAITTVPRRALVRGHLFMRGAFVLMDAVARTVLAVQIVSSL